jgi:hypothetical protein
MKKRIINILAGLFIVCCFGVMGAVLFGLVPLPVTGYQRHRVGLAVPKCIARSWCRRSAGFRFRRNRLRNQSRACLIVIENFLVLLISPLICVSAIGPKADLFRQLNISKLEKSGQAHLL